MRGTGATVVLIAAGSIVWAGQLRTALTGPAGLPRSGTPRLEGIMISEARRSALWEGAWRAEGSLLPSEGGCWRVERIDEASAVLSRGGAEVRVPLRAGNSPEGGPQDFDCQGRRL